MFSNPKMIVDKMGIVSGMVIADVGSGSGEYSIALAKAVGHSGRVYAIDVQKDLLTKVKSLATKEGIETLEVIWGDVEKSGGAGLSDSVVDVVVMANLLFQVEDKKTVVSEAVRIVKPQGRIIVIDWSDSFGGIGPRPADVVTSEKAQKMFEEFGFSKVSELNAGDHHYGLILQKNIMKNMTAFQLVLTGIFAIFIIVGVAFFALFRGGGDSGPVSNVIVWGLLPEAEFNQLLEVSGISENPKLNISYIKADIETYDQDFIEMLARGNVPDLIIIPHTSLLRHRDKLLAVPYKTYPERTFKSTFIEEGNLFLSEEGVLAFPLTVDPLVMYWNRTMFTNAGLASPPQYWDEFFKLTQSFVEKDQTFNITQSAISFGEYQNVTNAKPILSALIMQAGSSITNRTGTKVHSTLGDKFNQPIIPAEAAVNYYTEFSDPTKSFYSWNRSLPNSRDYFTAGDLAVYFGFASELDFINIKNPNLNFDAAVIPQSRGGAETITFGNILGLAIPRATRNASGALNVATILTSRDVIQELSLLIGLPPVRRDLLSDRPSDPFLAIFYDSALWSRGWLDPDKVATDGIFKTMVENITSGRKRVSDSVREASSSLQKLLSNVSI